MIVDAFTHIYPQPFLDYVRKRGLPLPVFVQDSPPFTEPAAKIAEMDRHGIDMQVLALGTPAFDELFSEDHEGEALEAARIANDGIAEVVTRYPDRFLGVATLPLTSLATVEQAREELDRAIGQLGLTGLQLYTSVAGHPIDLPAMFPLYETMTGYDLPILLHPVGGDYNARTHDYLLWLTFGWPFETSLAMARLVYSGVLERYPELKIVTHHLGAFPPYMAERIKGVSYTLERVSDWRLPHPILTYFKRFYGDTAVNGYRPALDTGYDFFGADHIVFASDHPFVPIGQTLQGVQGWDLPTEEKAQILGGNAVKLFKIE